MILSNRYIRDYKPLAKLEDELVTMRNGHLII